MIVSLKCNCPLYKVQIYCLIYNRQHISPFSFSVHPSVARIGSRQLQALSPEERAASVHKLAELLVTKQAQVLEANAVDLAEAKKSGLAKPLLSRLSLTPAKLKSLAVGLKQIADSSHQVRSAC